MVSIFFNSIWQVLAIGLLVGAGLPAIFAVGIRAMAAGAGGSAEIDSSQRPNPVARVLGILCFAVVVGAILLGISIIVSSGFGYKVSFEHIIPTFIEK